MSWRFGLGGSGCGFGCEQAADVDLGLDWGWSGGRRGGFGEEGRWRGGGLWWRRVSDE